MWTGELLVGTPPKSFIGRSLFRVAQQSKLIIYVQSFLTLGAPIFSLQEILVLARTAKDTTTPTLPAKVPPRKT